MSDPDGTGPTRDRGATDAGGGTTGEDITALDDTTVERIAAGEVVERPASVVKELVENSLDADAGRVAVEVERGGKDLVRVRDDGVGMTEAAVRKAVRQHTTSKIEHVRDIESGVATLGFRGEALHTIGAVSKLTVRTKPRGGDVGTELRMAGGDVVAVEPTGCPAGTTVEVTDLFYNTPAREKYLKRDRTEFARVNDVVTNYALAYPDVAVSLTHDGREVFATTGQGDLQAAILSVYGRKVAEAMVPVEAPAGDGGPLRGVEGYVSHPETTRSSREYVSAFVNGRYVQSTAAREAVVEAYGNQLGPDRYPFAVLFLEVPAEEVDVNVHPRKLAVRFSEEAAVREGVREAVRETLLDHGLVRSRAPRGRSAPDEVAVEPDRPDGNGAGDDATDGTDAADATGVTGGTGTDAGTSPSSPDGTARAGAGSDDVAGTRAGSDGTTRADAGTGASAGERDADPHGAGEAAPDRGDGATTGHGGVSAGDSGDATPTGHGGAAGRGGRSDGPGRKFRETTQRTLTGEPVDVEPAFETLPPLRVLGQYDDTYVVAEAPDGLVLVDQHAADERVNYERLRERVDGDAATQALADPVELELTAGEAALVEQSREALARAGFRATRAGERTVEVTAVPAVLAGGLDPDLLVDVLSGALDGGDADRPVEARADELLADLACYPSITGNTSLTEGSVLDLLAALDDCENPYACPHGRPVLVAFDDEEIDARFERDYPGHG